MAKVDYATCGATCCRLSLEFRYSSHEGSEVEVERKNLQPAALVLRGPKTSREYRYAQPAHVRDDTCPRGSLKATARCYFLLDAGGLPGPSATLGTLRTPKGHLECYAELVAAQHIKDVFPDRIRNGTLQLDWLAPRKKRQGVHHMLIVKAKPTALWRLYTKICEAQDRTPDSSHKPDGVKTEKVRAPSYNLIGKLEKTEEMKGFLRSPTTSAALAAVGGGGGGKPSHGAKLQAVVRAQRGHSLALQQRQLEAMRRPPGDRIPEAKAGKHGGDSDINDENENLQQNHTGSSATHSRRPSLAGHPVHSASQLGILASFRRSGASTFYGGGYRQDGLTNLGNTCYMSAILQALLRLPSFVHDLRTCTGRLRGEGEDTRTGTSLYAELLDVVKGLHGEQSVFNPKRLKDCISRRSPQYAGNAQQDAHEFLTDILDFMQAELRQSRAKHVPEGPAAADIPPICPTALNFRCVIEHRHVCCECDRESKRRELHHDLSLDLPRTGDPRTTGCSSAVPIQQLFDGYFAAETIEKTCESCGAKTAVVHKALVTLPRVLVLHLKRFDTKLMPAKTLADGTNVEPRWIAVKRPDLVKLDHAIEVRNQCTDGARVALPSSHTSRDLTRARAVPTAPHSAIKSRKQPLGLSSSNGISAAHRDRDTRSPSTASLSGGQNSLDRRNARYDDELKKAIAASLAEVVPSSASSTADEKTAGVGQPEDAIDVEDEHDQFVRAVEESLSSASTASVVECNDGEPAPKRTCSNSPPEAPAAAAPMRFTSAKLEPWETSAVEPWLGTLSGAATKAASTKYELHGVVSHFGSHADVGHYTTTIKLAPPSKPKVKGSASVRSEMQSEPYRVKWREYNDSTSTDNTAERMIDSERKQKHAYLAIYVLSNSLEPVDGGVHRQPKRKSSSQRVDCRPVDLTACDLTGTSDEDKGDTDEDDPIEVDGDRQSEDLFKDQPLQSGSHSRSLSPSRPQRSKADLRNLLNDAGSSSAYDQDMERALRLSISDK